MMKRFLLVLTLMSGFSALWAQVSYDITMMDKKRVVSGMQEIQKPDDEIFANLMLWATEQGPGCKDEILDCDFVKRQMTMVYNLKDDEKILYTCRLNAKVSQGRLVFLVSDVKMQGLAGMFSNFDKLNPEKKSKHQDIINEFQRINNQNLNEMLTFVNDHNPSITNWKNVCTGKIEAGMSSDEVRLIYGKPISIQENGANAQYFFSTFVYVFLEKGIVKSFVN